ncbi:acetate--CoA ligase family protein [Orrella marina]|nr:acetate--CoA ligase family protein [Orrella marina]
MPINFIEIESMKKFFYPESIVLVGASENKNKIGGKILNAIVSCGYNGTIYPVNNKREYVNDIKCYPDVTSVSKKIDLAIISVPAPLVLESISQCAECNIPYAIIISSGFSEAGNSGKNLQLELKNILRNHSMRISGPNAEGFYAANNNLVATFSPGIRIKNKNQEIKHVKINKSIGLISQSGGLGFSFYERGKLVNLDFNYIVSTGNQVDLEISDYADYMLGQDDTAALLMYVESFINPKRFVEIAKNALKSRKPIVMIKTGRTDVGTRAIASHTGAIASSSRIVDAVLEDCGVIQGYDQSELLDITAALTQNPTPNGTRVAVISASGGAAVWMSDALREEKYDLPILTKEHQNALSKFIPSFGSVINPIDTTAHMFGKGIADILEMVIQFDYIDAIVLAVSLANTQRLVNEGERIASLIRSVEKTILIYSYTVPSDESVQLLRSFGLYCFTSIRGCVISLNALRDYGKAYFFEKNNTKISSINSNTKSDSVSLIESSIKKIIPEFHSKKILRKYGISSVDEGIARNIQDARAIASQIGYPVVLKAHSSDLAHKSDAHAVILNINNDAELEASYKKIINNVKDFDPSLVIEEMLIQSMAGQGIEMIMGIQVDKDFGPIVMIGAGGIFAEVLEDVVLAPAPLSLEKGWELISRLKISKILSGVRGNPPADVEALVDAIVRFSILANDLHEVISEFDVNPVIVHPKGQGISIVDALCVKR